MSITPHVVPTPAAEVATSIEEELLPAIDRYLQNLPSSSYGRHYSIDSPEGRERAAAAILNTFRGVFKELRP